MRIRSCDEIKKHCEVDEKSHKRLMEEIKLSLEVEEKMK